ncbi:MAG: HAD hydrolase family protein, partial [Oscillospiraceae bacterium]|nr:HAD hydrolase family protein [Oscillospiraceae bacterium]
SMLKVSALSFAPANAIPAVLEVADKVVGHCRDGALADMIEELEKRY